MLDAGVCHCLYADSYTSFMHLENGLKLGLLCKGMNQSFKFVPSPALDVIKNGRISKEFKMVNRDLCTVVTGVVVAEYKNFRVNVELVYNDPYHLVDKVSFTSPKELEDLWKRILA